MDETSHDCTVIGSNNEHKSKVEAAAQARGLLSQTILYTADTGNSGKSSSAAMKLSLYFRLYWTDFNILRVVSVPSHSSYLPENHSRVWMRWNEWTNITMLCLTILAILVIYRCFLFIKALTSCITTMFFFRKLWTLETTWRPSTDLRHITKWQDVAVNDEKNFQRRWSTRTRISTFTGWWPSQCAFSTICGLWLCDKVFQSCKEPLAPFGTPVTVSLTSFLSVTLSFSSGRATWNRV